MTQIHAFIFYTCVSCVYTYYKLISFFPLMSSMNEINITGVTPGATTQCGDKLKLGWKLLSIVFTCTFGLSGRVVEVSA